MGLGGPSGFSFLLLLGVMGGGFMLIAFRVLEFSLLDLFGNFYSLVFSRYLRHTFGRPTEATLFLAVGLPL